MKKHHGCNQILDYFNNKTLIVLVIVAVILFMGEELLEWILCDEKILIWIVSLMLLLTNFEFDCC